MGRPAKHSDESILDAALAVVAQRGTDATVEAVATHMGGLVGSVYYRFDSRDTLMIRLWLRSIRRFHVALLAALDHEDAHEALTRAARCIPDYCRAHPDEARALTLYRHSELLAACPDQLREEVAALNTHVFGVVADVVRRRYDSDDLALMMLARTAVQQLPYGLVRPYIGENEPIPLWITDVAAAGAKAALDLGDTWR